MVTPPRAPMGAHGLRPLGLPRPLDVRLDGLGLPGAVVRGGEVLPVACVEDVWRVAEAWWREESVARTYMRLLMADGRLLTVFHDDARTSADGWYEQRY